jgi:chromosome partitioning protein
LFWVGHGLVLVVGCASQKGGVAKSSLARLLAREYADAGRRVLLADLDVLQATSLDWARRRTEAGLQPEVPVVRCESAKQALKRARDIDAECLVLDARGIVDQQTLEVARASGAVLIPSGLAVDDLLPAVRLAHELIRAGIRQQLIAVALCRAGDAPGELGEARRYIAEAGYRCLDVAWPERAGYRRAHDEGRVATEAHHPSLRANARAFAAAAIGFVEEQALPEKGRKHAKSRG